MNFLTLLTFNGPLLCVVKETFGPAMKAALKLRSDGQGRIRVGVEKLFMRLGYVDISAIADFIISHCGLGTAKMEPGPTRAQHS